MKKRSRRPADVSKEDWDAVDVPEQTAEDFRAMRPATEALPVAIKRLIGQRGSGRKPPKVAVSLRLDRDVVERFKSGGPGWQSRMNTVLKAAAKRAPLRAKPQ
ncbi:MAG: BrnA antitoxin family protein [Parvularculaceae bacterium]